MAQRNTIQRTLVLSALMQLKGHPTAEDVYTLIHPVHPGVSKATVYRNLNVLCEAGELIRISLPNEGDRFDYTLNAHAHIKCKACGEVKDVHIKDSKNIEQEIIEETGYLVLVDETVHVGICPTCRAKAITR